MTSADCWFDAAVNLYKEKIAEPVFWLGDNRHYKKAEEYFENCYIADFNNVTHYPWRLENNEYNAEFSDFFYSENYLRCKDICIKLMDRLDTIGMLTRLDREMYLKTIAHWALKKVAELKPDALIMAEAPHSHGQYLIYEIFLYLKIPVAQHVWWTIQPTLMLQRMPEGDFVSTNTTFSLREWKEMDLNFESYIKRIAKSSRYEDFIPQAIIEQKRKSSIMKTILGYFSKESIKELAAEKYRNLKFSKKEEFLPVNPQNMGILMSEWIRENKRKKVIKAFRQKVDSCDLNKEFVYIALHHEPERTTNPDGGPFHDQLMVVMEMRKLLPEHIEIYVKEHPSQFYIRKAARGRSPLLYDAVKRIKGVKLIDTAIDTSILMEKAQIVCTVTGTIAIEAATLGKKTLYFGNAWYNGLPNAIRWHKDITYEEIMNTPTANSEEICTYMLNMKSQYGIPCFRSQCSIGDFKFEDRSPEFKKVEIEGVIQLAKQYWELYEQEYQKTERVYNTA